MKRSNQIWAIIALVAGLLLVWSISQASPIVFNFSSPSFSGVGQSSHYLTIENLEKSRVKALEDERKAEERRLENELKNSAIEVFRRNLETLFYSTLATQIIDNVFGVKDDQQNDGETTIDGYKIVWTSTDEYGDDDGVGIIITNVATGEVIYNYGFPYQEEPPSDD